MGNTIKQIGIKNSSGSYDYTPIGVDAQYVEVDADGKTLASKLNELDAKSVFTKVAVGSNTISADAATDTLTLAGSNVTLTADTTNDKVTIGVTKQNVVDALGYTPPTKDTTYSDFVKSGSSAKSGLVPKPPTTAGTTKYLREDGTWAVPPDNNTTYSAATQSAAGLMSASDKAKLDGIAAGANAITVDSALSSSSTNPVQNKIINSALGGKLDSGTSRTKNTVYAAPNGSNGSAGFRALVPADLPAFKGATSSAAGTAGIVPAAAAGDQSKFLRGDGTWATVASGGASASYGTSSSGATYSNKVATCDSNFSLKTGQIVTIQFTGGITIYGTCTLNINDTGAKNINFGYSYASSQNIPIIPSNGYGTFIYTGTEYLLISVSARKYQELNAMLKDLNYIAAAPPSDTDLSTYSSYRIPMLNTNFAIGVIPNLQNIASYVNSQLYSYSSYETTLLGEYDANASSPSSYTALAFNTKGQLWRVDLSEYIMSLGEATSSYSGGIGNRKWGDGTKSAYYFWHQQGSSSRKPKTRIETAGYRGASNTSYDQIDFYIGETNSSGASSTVTNSLRVTNSSVSPGTTSGINLGTSSLRWGTIYAASGTIQTSDRNKKLNIEGLDTNKTINFVMGLNPVSYKFIDGTSNRTHYGLVSQDIEELLERLNMTSLDFGGFIKSPKIEEVEVVVRQEEVVLEDGTIEMKDVTVKQPHVIEGEYEYSLRYEEFIAPLIKTVQVQQLRLDEQEERIAKLEAAIAALTN